MKGPSALPGKEPFPKFSVASCAPRTLPLWGGQPASPIATTLPSWLLDARSTNTFGVRFRSVPVVQGIERGLPKAKRALLLTFAPVVCDALSDMWQRLATTYVSSALIQNTLILHARVTQKGDTNVIQFNGSLVRPTLELNGTICRPAMG